MLRILALYLLFSIYPMVSMYKSILSLICCNYSAILGRELWQNVAVSKIGSIRLVSDATLHKSIMHFSFCMLSGLYSHCHFSHLSLPWLSCFLAAGLLNWSLISLIDLVVSLIVRFAAPKRGRCSLWSIHLNVVSVQLVLLYFYHWMTFWNSFSFHLLHISLGDVIASSWKLAAAVWWTNKSYVHHLSPSGSDSMFSFPFPVGFRFKGRVILLWFIFTFSVVVILSQVIYLIVLAITGLGSEVADTWWIRLIGLMK